MSKSKHYDMSRVQRGLVQWEMKVNFAVRRVADYFAVVFENYAKENAPWTDRTGNARQSLHAWVDELSGNIVRLYLSHGVNYGLALETRFSGKYAIIWSTVQANLPAVRKMLHGVFGR